MDVSAVAATLASILLGAVILLQIALVVGAPLGHLAWGGRVRVLSGGRRAGSAIAGAILFLAGWLILARAGLARPGPEAGWVRAGTWVFAGFFLLNTAGNFASTSRWERRIMTPITAALVICFVIVGLTGG